MDLFKKIYIILNPFEKFRIFLLLLITLVSTLIETLSIGMIVPIFSILFEGNAANNIYFISEIDRLTSDLSYINKSYLLISLLIIIFIIKNCFLSFKVYWINNFTTNICVRLSDWLFEIYLRKPFLFHIKNNSADLIRNISQEVNFLQLIITGSTIILSEFLIIISIISLLLYVNFISTLIIVIFILVIGSIYWFFSSKLLKSWGEQRLKSSGIAIKHIMQGIGAIRDVKISGNENFFLRKFKTHNLMSRRANFKFTFVKSLPVYGFETIAVISLSLLLLILIQTNNSLVYIFPILTIFAASAFRLLPSANRIFAEILAFKFRFAPADLICNEIIGLKDEKLKDFKHENNLINSKFPKYIEQIKLNNIFYTYPDTKKIIINNLSIDLKLNRINIIYGESGSGKTTLLNLITGLLEPNKGKIFVNNSIDINYNDFYLKSWQSKIGFVSQNTYLIDDSILNNIVLGKHRKDLDYNLIDEILKDCKLYDFVNQLEDGINTIVGERGSALSGGQIQRIGIARALFNNPQILILDEPTSSLDADTESEIFKTIKNMSKNRLVLIITHRKSLIQSSDEIFHLSNGRLTKK